MLAGLVGLAISYALSVTGLLSGVVTSFTETEKQMVSVERAMQYITGAPAETDSGSTQVECMVAVIVAIIGERSWLEDYKERMRALEQYYMYVILFKSSHSFSPPQPPPDWPTAGRVEFQSVTLSYRYCGRCCSRVAGSVFHVCNVQYREDHPPALDGVSFVAKPGEKVCV